jgi:hypothetical protein
MIGFAIGIILSSLSEEYLATQTVISSPRFAGLRMTKRLNNQSYVSELSGVEGVSDYYPD